MEIERIHTRKFESVSRELHKSLVRLHRQGVKQVGIAVTLGVRKSKISIWLGKVRNGQETRESKRGGASEGFVCWRLIRKIESGRTCGQDTGSEYKVLHSVFNLLGHSSGTRSFKMQARSPTR